MEEKKTFKQKAKDWMEKHPTATTVGIWCLTIIAPLGCGYVLGKQNGTVNGEKVHNYLLDHTKPGYLVHDKGCRLDLFYDDGTYSHLEMDKASDMNNWEGWP